MDYVEYFLNKIINNKLTTDNQKLEYLKILWSNTKWYRDKIFIYIEYLRAKIDFENRFYND